MREREREGKRERKKERARARARERKRERERESARVRVRERDKPPVPINHFCSLPGSQICENYFIYCSIQMYKSRVAKTHRMPEVAGHFSQKSH